MAKRNVLRLVWIANSYLVIDIKKLFYNVRKEKLKSKHIKISPTIRLFVVP